MIDSFYLMNPTLDEQMFLLEILEDEYSDLIDRLHYKANKLIKKSCQTPKIIQSSHEIKKEQYKSSDKTICIPFSITKVHPEAFINCKQVNHVNCDSKWLRYFPCPLNIVKVVIPEGQIKIMKKDFEGLLNLQIITLPESLKEIEENSFINIQISKFQGNPKFLKFFNKIDLTKAVIPDYVTEIPPNTFYECKSLCIVKIEPFESSKLKIIHSRAFAFCESLKKIELPDSLTKIAPDAFLGCSKKIESNLSEKQQKSLIKVLVIDDDETTMSKNYKDYINVETLEIPLTTKEFEDDVLQDFKNIKYLKCDPNLFNQFKCANSIEFVFIPEGIKRIERDHFSKFTNLKFLEIPKTVDYIEMHAFKECKNLDSIRCGKKHLLFLPQKQIKSLIIYDIKTDPSFRLEEKDLDDFVNLEKLSIPKSLQSVHPNALKNCYKLSDIDNDMVKKCSNRVCTIIDGNKVIKKKLFENWTCLEILSIPESVEEIEDGCFDNCKKIKFLICDPKFYKYFHKYSIEMLRIPPYVKKINKADFHHFFSLRIIELNDGITHIEPDIFDSCENLVIIDCNPILLTQLSDKIKKRCHLTENKYIKPNYNFQKNVIFENDKDIAEYKKANIGKKEPPKEILLDNEKSDDDDVDDDDDNDDTDNKKSPEMKKPKAKKTRTVEDLVNDDKSNKFYAKNIDKVYKECTFPQPPLDKIENKTEFSIKDLTNICIYVCSIIYNKSKEKDKMRPRPVQILAILRIANEIQNNREKKGAIGQIKTGEGKSFIISILTIMLVLMGHTVDIVTSNMQLAKRDQEEQKKYFDLFGISTGVLYNTRSDFNFFGDGSISKMDSNKNYRNFNTKIFKCKVVYSTNSNFEFVYLNNLFSNVNRSHGFDIVLVDEVDNMFIDESMSPAVISKSINYTYSRHILEIVFVTYKWKTDMIQTTLKYYLPNCGEFKDDDIETLKRAVRAALAKQKNIHYIIENDNVIIIDQNTGFKKPGSRWSNYIHEMVEIKEGLPPKLPSVSLSQVTQHGYFNLYKKIAGVTGTLGDEADKKLLIDEYNIELFEIPRHSFYEMPITIKRRPYTLDQIYYSVYDEIKEVTKRGRPVLVIWDSINNVNNFISRYYIQNVNKIDAISPENDQKAIKKAGKTKAVTIATSAAGRGVDIKLSKNSIKNGGLHVIIPMKMRSQRSLEQAIGRAGRSGQPGSATVYDSNDEYLKTSEFEKGYDNLASIQHKFSEYIKKSFAWMLEGKGEYGFSNVLIPFQSPPDVTFDLYAHCIKYEINCNPLSPEFTQEKYENQSKDLLLEMLQTGWAVFFSQLSQNIDKCADKKYCTDQYDEFLVQMKKWFDPSCNTAEKAMKKISLALMTPDDWKDIIVHGIKIGTFIACVIFPECAFVISLVSGVVLSGGEEVYKQIQEGRDLNWWQIITKATGAGVKCCLEEKLGPLNVFWKVGIDTTTDVVYELCSGHAQLQDIGTAIGKNIVGASEDTIEWLIAHRSSLNKEKFKQNAKKFLGKVKEKGNKFLPKKVLPKATPPKDVPKLPAPKDVPRLPAPKDVPKLPAPKDVPRLPAPKDVPKLPAPKGAHKSPRKFKPKKVPIPELDDLNREIKNKKVRDKFKGKLKDEFFPKPKEMGKNFVKNCFNKLRNHIDLNLDHFKLHLVNGQFCSDDETVNKIAKTQFENDAFNELTKILIEEYDDYQDVDMEVVFTTKVYQYCDEFGPKYVAHETFDNFHNLCSRRFVSVRIADDTMLCVNNSD